MRLLLGTVSGGGFRVYGVQHARGIDQRGARVHSYSDSERFSDFFLRGAGFQRRVSMHDDAAVAVSCHRYGQRNELPCFFAELARLGIGSAERLIAANRVWRNLHQVSDASADFLMILIPIHHHGNFSSRVIPKSIAIILSTSMSVISSPVHPSLPGRMAIVAARRTPFLVRQWSSRTYSKEPYS